MELEANTSNEPSNNPTHEAVQFYWGERCAEHEDGCPTCIAWEHYDNLVNTSSFVYNPERDGPAEFVPPKSLQIALESHEQHHAQAKEKFPNLFDEFAERAPKDIQVALIKVLNTRTLRFLSEQGLDKV